MALRLAAEMLSREDKQVHAMHALGLSEAELIDLTLAASPFSALAIIEPIGEAVAPNASKRSNSQPGPALAGIDLPTGPADGLPSPPQE